MVWKAVFLLLRHSRFLFLDHFHPKKSFFYSSPFFSLTARRHTWAKQLPTPNIIQLDLPRVIYLFARLVLNLDIFLIGLFLKLVFFVVLLKIIRYRESAISILSGYIGIHKNFVFSRFFPHSFAKILLTKRFCTYKSRVLMITAARCRRNVRKVRVSCKCR